MRAPEQPRLTYGEMKALKRLGIDIVECKIIEMGRGGTRYIRLDDLIKQGHDAPLRFAIGTPELAQFHPAT